MRYYKIVQDGYIPMIGTGRGGTEISKEEYDYLLSIFYSMPIPPYGYSYRLREDLTWEEYVPPVAEPTEEENGYMSL